MWKMAFVTDLDCPAGQCLCPSGLRKNRQTDAREAKRARSPRTATLYAAEELQPLPDYEPQREISYMIRLTLMNHENEQRTSVLDLPATEQRMQEVQKELDAPEWFDAQFTGCDAIAPQLNSMLTDVEDLPRINELAKSLQELKASGQLTKFKAVVGATQCESLDDVFDRH